MRALYSTTVLQPLPTNTDFLKDRGALNHLDYAADEIVRIWPEPENNADFSRKRDFLGAVPFPPIITFL